MGAGSIPAYSTPINARAYYTDGTFTSVIAGTAINTAMPQGAWSHLACVISREASTVRVFINGSQVASAALTAGKTLDGIASNCAVSGFSAPGLIDDAVLYGRALSDAEITRLATAPAAPTTNASLHLEAEVWVGRVIGSGGSVSTSTAQAVSDFCTAIDAAGIRDRFYRLNLFCGSNLTAALVPLYRGPSLTGTQYGNATDTNNNFVSGDYVETGTSGGLTRASGSKTLSTGLTPANAPQFATGHVATSVVSNSFVSTGFAIDYGTVSQVRSFHFINGTNANSQFLNVVDGTNVNISGAAVTNGLYSRWIGSRTSATSVVIYRNATSYATRTETASQTSSPFQLTIFGAAVGLHYYSLGDGMTASQVSAFDSALAAFLTALGRA